MHTTGNLPIRSTRVSRRSSTAGTPWANWRGQRSAGGILIGEEYYQRVSAESSIQTLLPDALVPAPYEAAFSFEDNRTRIDIRKGPRAAQDSPRLEFTDHPRCLSSAVNLMSIYVWRRNDWEDSC